MVDRASWMVAGSAVLENEDGEEQESLAEAVKGVKTWSLSVEVARG